MLVQIKLNFKYNFQLSTSTLVAEKNRQQPYISEDNFESLVTSNVFDKSTQKPRTKTACFINAHQIDFP